jgi:sodium/potassium-transporting ATPase subunit alpha
MLVAARLCNGAKYEASIGDDATSERKIKGDATDSALLRFVDSELHAASASSAGSPNHLSSAIIDTFEKIFEIPFNSGIKWMMSVVRERSQLQSETSEETTAHEPWMLIKGAPDVLFPSCSYIMKPDGTSVPFDDVSEAKLRNLQESFGSVGQRVLVLCKRSLETIKVDPAAMSANDVEELLYSEVRDLTVIGLVALRDPPRSDVEGAVATIRRAGVRVVMVTGDFALTAIAIAKQVKCLLLPISPCLCLQQVGIVTVEKIDTFEEMKKLVKPVQNPHPHTVKPSEDDPIRALVLTGDDIEKMDARDWDAVLGNYTEIIYARTTPEQKLKIVEQSKARGDNIVAVVS